MNSASHASRPWSAARQPKRSAARLPEPRRRRRLLIESLEERAVLSTFTVSNLNDTGAGSLRAAISSANASPGADTIVFTTTGRINVATQLSLTDVSGGTTIDATTAPGYSGTPLVEIKGPNSLHGLDILSPNNTVQGLQITSFTIGVYIVGNASGSFGPAGTASNTLLAANYIGTDGATALGGLYGVVIDGSANNRIGAVDGAGAGNLISGNQFEGIRTLQSSSTGNVIAGNRIGTNAAGTAAVANGLRGVMLLSPNNVVGTDGDGLGDAGEGNLISGNGGPGVEVDASGNVVAGNLIGTNAAGTAAVGNATSNGGVFINAGGNRIGTDGNGVSDALERNVISGNVRGVVVNGGTGNIVAGNFVGTNAAGDAAVPNTGLGVFVSSGTNTRIGTNGDGAGDAAERNVVSGNSAHGILVQNAASSGTIIAGNFVGLDAAGTTIIANQQSGVRIDQAPNTRVGTNADGVSDALERNVISGNSQNGVEILNVASTVFAGNYVGTDVTGLLDRGNHLDGIQMSSGRVGTNSDGVHDDAEGNVLSGNDGNGVLIFGSGAIVAGNALGVGVDRTTFVGNTGNGVLLQGGSGATIGGAATAARNVVAANGGAGVYVQSGTGNTIRGNSIFRNTRLGIDLGALGTNANDANDADSGANNLQNYPVLTAADSDGVTTTISGTLNSTANATFTLEFFASVVADPSGFGEGERSLGTAVVTTNGSGAASFTANLTAPASGGEYLAATATDAGGNTSEFSASSLRINAAPIVTSDAYSVAEDHTLTVPAASGVLTNDLDPDGDSFTALLVSPPTHGAVTLHANGSFEYVPDADFQGLDQFTYQATDGHHLSSTATVTIQVTPVNDAPSFDTSASYDAFSDDTPRSLAGWATDLLAGPADEAGQTLTFQVIGNSNPGLFATAPAIDASGTLTYTPAAGAVGVATLTIELKDDGGVADGGVDVSVPHTFVITSSHQIVTIDPGAYVGQYAPPAHGYVTGPTTLDLAIDSTYSVQIGETHVPFTLGPDGSLLSGNPTAVAVVGSTLQFQTTILHVDPAEYTGFYTASYVNSGVSVFGPQDFVVVRGMPNNRISFEHQNYWYYDVDAAGQVTSQNTVAAEGIGSTLRFHTTVIHVDPAEYTGYYTASSVNRGISVFGTQDFVVVPGIQNYRISFEHQNFWFYDVDAAGQVTSQNTAAAEGIGDTLRFHTTVIHVDPAEYTGYYTGSSVTRGVSVSGPQDFVVVPGIQNYRISFEHQNFWFYDVDAAGQVTSQNTAAAEGIGDTLRFHTAVIYVDPGLFTDRYHLASLSRNEIRIGPAAFYVVPGIDNYRVAIGADFQFFNVDAAGVPSPSTLTLHSGGDPYEFHLAAGPLASYPIVVDPGSYPGAYAVDGAWHTGVVSTADLAPGVHVVALPGDTFTFVVDAVGAVTSNSPGAASGAGSTLLFNNSIVTVDEGTYSGYFNFNNGFGQYGQSTQTLVVVPGLRNYQLTLGALTDLKFDVAADGNVTSQNPAAAEGVGSHLVFHNVVITIDPGAYDGLVATANYFDAQRLSLDLVPGLSGYFLGFGGNAGLYFDIDADGNAISHNTVAATSDGGTLHLHSVLVHVERNGYVGAVSLGATQQGNNGPDYQLVRNIDNYMLQTAEQAWVLFGVEADGTVTSHSPNAVAAAGSTLTLQTVGVLFDPGSYVGDYSLGYTSQRSFQGTNCYAMVADMGDYHLDSPEGVFGYFRLDADGIPTPGELSGTIAGQPRTFTLSSCSLEPQLAAIGAQSATVGSDLSFTATVTGAAGHAYLFSLDAGAPAGATIDPQTGVFHFTPTSGPATLSATVRVTDAQTSRWTDFETITIEVAPVVDPQHVSVLLLNPTVCGALTASGAAQLHVDGTIMVDSSCAKNAIAASGSVSISAAAIKTVGGVRVQGAATLSPAPVTGATVMSDPLASLAVPAAGPSRGSVTCSTGQRTLEPGLYSQLKASGNCSLVLQSGIYEIAGGGISISGSASLDASAGVLLYNAGSNFPNAGGNFGGVTLSGTGSLAISPLASGPYAGVALFQARDNAKPIALSGSASLVGLQGTIYARAAQLNLSGAATLDADLIVDTLRLSGSASSPLSVGDHADTNEGVDETAILAAGQLASGILWVAASDESGALDAERQARIDDSIDYLSATFAPFGLTLVAVEPDLAEWADIRVVVAATSPCGGAADGILGCTSTGGQVAVLRDWNWYGGADASALPLAAFDFQTVLTHELGHAIGIDHSSDSASVMFASLAAGVARRELTTADLAALGDGSSEGEEGDHEALAAVWLAPIAPLADESRPAASLAPAATPLDKSELAIGARRSELPMFAPYVDRVADRRTMRPNRHPDENAARPFAAHDAAFADPDFDWRSH